MNKALGRFGLLLPLFCAGVAITAVLRAVALSLFFNFETGYFDGTVLITVSNWVVLGLCVLLFSAALAIGSDKKYRMSFDSPLTFVPSGAVALGIVFVAIGMIEKIAGAIEIGKGIPTFELAVLVFAVIGAASFAVNSFVVSVESEHRALFSIGFVAFLAVYIAYLYFNSELPLNAPNKTVDLFAIISFMLFFLFETRVSLGREKQRLYLASGLISALLCAYSALPSLFVYFIRDEVISFSVYESVMMLGAFAYSLSRIILFSRQKEDRNNEVALALAAAAEKRSLEIESANDVRRMAYIEMINRMAYVEEESDAPDEVAPSGEPVLTEAETDFSTITALPGEEPEDFDE